MAFGEGGATGRHGPTEAGGGHPDDVGVALAHHHLAVLHHLGLGPVEPVEDLPLVVEGASGGVLVLGALGPGQDPPAQGHGIAPDVEDREQHPAPEAVLEAVALVDEPQTGVARHIGGQRQRPAQRVPLLGRPSQPVPAHDLAVVAPRS